MIQILMVSGKQGSGKTTLCNQVLAKFFAKKDWDVFHLTFAKIIYELHDHILSTMKFYGVNLPHPQKDGYLLQLLGTEWARNKIGPNVWMDVLKGVMKDVLKTKENYQGYKPANTLFVISDCRFENEFDAFPEALRVRLVCDEKVRKSRVSMWRETTNHPSETGLDGYARDQKFDLYLNTAKTPIDGCASLTMAKLEKGAWCERRETLQSDRPASELQDSHSEL